MPKTKRPTTFQHPIFGTVEHKLCGIFMYDSEVCGKEPPRSEYVLQHRTELYTNIFLHSVTEEIDLYEDIRELYNIYLKVKEEKAKDDAMWAEILTIITSPDFIERSPSPDCNIEQDFKRRRVLVE